MQVTKTSVIVNIGGERGELWVRIPYPGHSQRELTDKNHVYIGDMKNPSEASMGPKGEKLNVLVVGYSGGWQRVEVPREDTELSGNGFTASVRITTEDFIPS